MLCLWNFPHYRHWLIDWFDWSIRQRSQRWGEAGGHADGGSFHRPDEVPQDENAGTSSSLFTLQAFTAASFPFAVRVQRVCAAGGDPAAGEGDHHLQAVFQELELNVSPILLWKTVCIGRTGSIVYWKHSIFLCALIVRAYLWATDGEGLVLLESENATFFLKK